MSIDVLCYEMIGIDFHKVKKTMRMAMDFRYFSLLKTKRHLVILFKKVYETVCVQIFVSN